MMRRLAKKRANTIWHLKNSDRKGLTPRQPKDAWRFGDTRIRRLMMTHEALVIDGFEPLGPSQASANFSRLFGIANTSAGQLTLHRM